MSGSPPLQMEARSSEMTFGEIWAWTDISAPLFVNTKQREARYRQQGHGQGGNHGSPTLGPPCPPAWVLGMASPRARRELAHEMAGLVTSIFNSSIELGEAPSDWSIENVVPIFKSGGRRGGKVRQAGIGLRG